MYKLISITIFLLHILTSVKGQTLDTLPNSYKILPEGELVKPKDEVKKPEISFDLPLKDQLLPIDTLVAFAQQNSKIALQLDAMSKVGDLKVVLAKRDFLKNIVGTASYFVGNQNNLVYSANPIDQASSLFINGYRTGGTIYIPLDVFFTRNPKIKIAQAEALELKYRKEELYQNIHNQVILSYNNFITSFDLLMIANESRQLAQTNFMIAEKEFKEGVLSVAELSKVSEYLYTTKQAYEESKGRFFIAYNAFEVMMGKKMEELLIY